MLFSVFIIIVIAFYCPTQLF